MAARIPAEERLTNLVVALMATEIGLTKQQILDNVSGYRQRAEAGTRSDALEKMFERDKDELRSLGVPIETIGDAADPNDLREARYRIPQAEYDLPSDIEFSPAELAVLQLAGSVWSAESVSGDAQSGVRKIRALGIDGDEPIIGFAPRITARDAAFSPLQDAIERSRVVAFDYLKPGEDAPRRRPRPPAGAGRLRGTVACLRRRRRCRGGPHLPAQSDRRGCAGELPELRPRPARRCGGSRTRRVGTGRVRELGTPGDHPGYGGRSAPGPKGPHQLLRASTCPSWTCTSSRTNSPRTVQRFAWSSPHRCATP